MILRMKIYILLLYLQIKYIKKIYYLNKHVNIKCLVDINLKQIFRDISINDCNKLLLMLQ